MRIIEDSAVALSGGSYKCEFQIYPLLLLEKLVLYPRDVFAISGGVPNMLGYIMGKTERLVQSWIDVEPRKLYEFDYLNCLVRPMLHGKMPILQAPSIFKASKTLEEVVDRETDFESLFASPVTAHVGTVDLLSNKVVWFSTKDPGMTPAIFRQIVLASMRIPIFFPPVDIEIGGRAYQLIDAGLVTNLPVAEAVACGFKRIIAINSIPEEFLPISSLGLIPEFHTRYTEAQHFAELGHHVERIERINRNAAVLEASRKLLADPRIPDEIRAGLEAEWQKFTFAGKRHIALCLMNPPSQLSIFQKHEREMYGSPSAEARFELLGAGVKAAELVLMPFLREQNLLTASEEFREIYDWKPAVSPKAISQLIHITLSKRIWRGVKRHIGEVQKSPLKAAGKMAVAAAVLALFAKMLFRRRKQREE